MQSFERRYSDRLPIQDAKVEYTNKNGIVTRVDLLDLTKSSVWFSTSEKKEIGELIKLKLIIPDEDVIDIQGMVIRNSGQDEKLNPYTVVQFDPFGSNGIYNSLKSLIQIKKILEITVFEL